LVLLPAQLPPTTTLAAPNSLTYTWHTLKFTNELYDTAPMFRVVRKTLQLPGSFPITSWEFTGPTTLVEIQGFLEVVNPGVYGFSVSSNDRFLVWLQDKWLSLGQVGPEGAGLGLQPGDWVTSVEFKAAGELHLLSGVLNHSDNVQGFQTRRLE
jgi:hypothetical protein